LVQARASASIKVTLVCNFPCRANTPSSAMGEGGARIPGASTTAARLQIMGSQLHADRVGRGRGHGLYDRTEPSDRRAWNSDDEDFDEFGRRKKKKAKVSHPSQKAEETACGASGSATGSRASSSLTSPSGSSGPLQEDVDKRTKSGVMVYCRFHAQGKCSRGVSCPFSHEVTDLVTVPLEQKIRRLCKFFEAGSCTSGLACPFAHGPDELEELLAIRPAPRRPVTPLAPMVAQAGSPAAQAARLIELSQQLKDKALGLHAASQAGAAAGATTLPQAADPQSRLPLKAPTSTPRPLGAPSSAQPSPMQTNGDFKSVMEQALQNFRAAVASRRP